MGNTAPTDIVTFANAAARDSQITAPAIGQGVFLVDSGSVLFYYGRSLGWLPEWNLPWGRWAYTEIHTNQGLGNGYLGNIPEPNLTITFTPIPNRRYEVEFLGRFDSGAKDDIIAFGVACDSCFYLWEGFGTLCNTSIAFEALTVQMPGTAGTLANMRAMVSFPVSAVTRLYVVAGQISGTGGIFVASTNGVCAIRLTDVGPKSAPAY